MPKQIGEVFGAVNFAVFADDLLIPHRARGEEGFILNRVEILGAGEMQILLVAAAHDGEIERLGIDREFVFAELDNVLAVDVQLLFILELADRFFVDGFELGLDALRFTGFFQRGEFLNAFADGIDNPIGGHVSVDIVDIVEGAELVLHALEHSFGGSHQRGGFAVAGLLELQAFLFKGGFQLAAFFIELLDVLREIREVAPEIFQLVDDVIKILVTFFRRVGHIQIIHRRLAEQ